jgi:hypothetical protein
MFLFSLSITTWKFSPGAKRPHPIPLLIGEGISKIVGNLILPKFLLILSPIRGEIEKGLFGKLPSRIKSNV